MSESRRPVIGLTTYGEQVRLGAGEQYVAALPMAYVRAVQASGGRAVLLPEDDPGTDVLDALDGIVFTGGADVSPAFYGETPHPATYLRPARDDAEMTLLRGAVDRDMPVLAICRGMQLLTVAYGGRLHQHLPDVLGNDSHRPAAAGYGSHDVRLAAGSACAAMLGERTTVNSLHHQGIADVGSLTATGWAIDNQSPGNGGPDKVGSGSAGVVGSGLAGVTGSGSAGVVGSGSAGVVGSGPAGLVEAVEDPSKSFVVGVQWHPEQMTDWRLFAGFIRAVRESLDRVRGAAASDPEPAVS